MRISDWSSDVCSSDLLCAVGILLVTGVLGIDDVLGALSNPALATVGAMFVLSAALDRTGVIDGIGRLMIRSADASPALALLSLMLGVMLLSAFINNTPVVVILTPVAIAFAQASGPAPSKLLIPLSYASILGGTTTLLDPPPNLLVAGAAQRVGRAPSA